MTRRTLDIIFSIGGLLLAGLILTLGLVLQNQANFAEDYVHDQLQAQQITFTPAQALSPEENAQCLKDTQKSSWSPASRPSATPTNTSACTYKM